MALAHGEQFAVEARELRDVRRRGRRRVVEQLAQHPRAALDGAGVLAVAAHREDGRHAEQSAARRTGGQRDFAELVAAHAVEAVVVGEQAVDDDEVGLEQAAQAEVLAQQAGEGLIHLLARGGLGAVVEGAVEPEIELEKIEPVHAEPLMREAG